MKLKVFLFFFTWTFLLKGQQEGMPYYRVYKPNEYQGHRQNWAITQDSMGTMHFANEGLLSFDGENWQLNPVPNQRHLRSLDSGHGKIYVGGNDELGYFEKIHGKYEFTSLAHHVPDSLKSFDRVWTTKVHEDAVFFQTDTFVLRISKDGKSKVWPFVKNNVWKLLKVNNQIHIDIPKKGFHRLNEKDEFELIPNGENLRWVGMEFFIPTGQGWLVEQRDTLKIFDGERLRTFNHEASQILLEFGVDNGMKTKEGHLVFTMRKKGGVVVLNEQGKLLHHFKKDNGFSNELVRNLYEDKEGSIWFALNSGVSRMEITSPLRFYDETLGLDGTVFAIQRFQEKLYAGTSTGLKVLTDSRFEYVHEITALIKDLKVVQNQLIVATSRDELYALDSSGKIVVINDSKTGSKGITLEILPLKEDASSMIVLFETGIYQAKWVDGDWKVLEHLNGIFGDAEHLFQVQPGELWVHTGVRGVFRILYDHHADGTINLADATVMNYQEEKGVPQGVITMGAVGTHIFIQSQNNTSFQKFNREKDAFENIPNLKTLVGLEDGHIELIHSETTKEGETLWFKVRRGFQYFMVQSKQEGKNYSHRTIPLNHYATQQGDPRGESSFYAEAETVYFGGIQGIVAYNYPKGASAITTPKTYITRIVTSDTTYFDVLKPHIVKELRYNNQNLSFAFSTTNFKEAENRSYQYQLEGFDSNWSEPTKRYTKEYSSLPSGDYVFKVRALNDNGVFGPDASIAFTVASPWFWNQFSIPIYLLLLVLLIYGVSHWRNLNLKKKNLRLEEAVNQAVAQTQRQADEIAELYKVKNQFFANISHELRTPLTLILGPSTDLLEDDSLGKGQKSKLGFIQNNAKRLLRLINQLLDLSKLEAGKMTLRARQQNIIKLVSTITESFHSMAIHREIDLRFESDLDTLFVFYDAEKFEKVLINLLSNALKFTKHHGFIRVTVFKIEDTCVIEVKDSGIGINAEQLPYVFDRFFQADNSESREHEGTGIGLSLSKEMVALHGGEILVESEVGKGSVFRIQLPLGKDHLEEHELVQLAIPHQPKVEDMMTAISEPEPSQLESGAEERLLIVEDNQEMRAYIKSHLENNFHILEAENGLVGFETAKNEMPDLVLSDVMMPQLDGIQLCKKLKQDPATAHIPVVLLTAKASEQDRIHGLKIQADAYLAKPFNKVELSVVVQGLIANRRRLQKRFADSTLISPKDIAVTSMEQQFLENLVEAIEANLGDEHYSIEQLADTLNFSRSQLHRKMVSITTLTPSLYLRKYRLERAKILLEKGAGRVADIAYQVGFSSPSYFTKCFVEAFGTTPKNITK
ncbi:MAG: hybrid sensor histidine kinase/response regulator transcription factor [Bacteroidota bacterium]